MILALLLILLPKQIDLDFINQYVIWNVGQGQWITVIDTNICYHFDVGGEFFNSNLISEPCGTKKNIIYYSHWDWDHIGLTLKLKSLVSDICIANLPQGKAKSFKKKMLNTIPLCEKKFSKVKKLEFSYNKAKTENDLSHIYIFDQKFLIPGDSPKKMEKIWSSLAPKNIKWLSVSHHGSKSSSSEEFLKNRFFYMAFVSARQKVYGHPHKIIVERFKKHGIPLLKTEDWGNIHVLTL